MEITTRQEEFYFGPEGAPMFGALHLPDDNIVRGAVIICGSLAKEHMDACRGLRYLADDLARHRIAALRFDYPGVGDSADGQIRDDSVSRWRHGIGHGVDLLVSLGFTSVTGIGLRVGALLLDDVVASHPEIDRVVYWDPIGRGRSFVREQQALYRLSVAVDGADVGDAVPLIGATLSSTAAGELSTLEITGRGEHVGGRLVAMRPESTDKRVAVLTQRDDVEAITVNGMAEFIQPQSFLVALPVEAITAITGWIDEQTGPDLRTISTAALTGRAVLRIPSSDGATTVDVVEQIERIGEHAMFAIRTLPAEAHQDDDLPTVVFFATANDLHIGPNREWVDLSRRVAAAGGQAVRFDRTGAGESGRVVVGPTSIYSPAALDEAVEAVRNASTDPRNVLVTGVCSGSWYSAYVARELHTGAAVLINAIAWSWRRKRSAEGDVRPEDLGMPRDDPQWQKTPRGRMKAVLNRRLPYPVWRILGKCGVTQVPEVLLRPLLEAGVETTVVLSPHDLNWYTGQRGPEGVARIRPTVGRPAIITTESGDHTAFHEVVRSAVRMPVLEWVTRR